ncbi:MAG: hypothetical protein IJT32_01360, partial [Lachnospiraceae bacterium]|nr:hypothetical protein [Lachnospiraceae bacterium]
ATGASHTALSGAAIPLAEVADIDAKGPSLQATGTAQIQGAATQMQTTAVPMQGNAEQTAANVTAAAEPTRLSEAEEPVLARSFRLLPQTATFIKKRSAFERMPEQSYVNMLFDKYAGIREEVNIMELEPPSLHGASNKSIRLLEHVDAYIADACASYGMKRSEFFNYIVEKEMKAVGWA